MAESEEFRLKRLQHEERLSRVFDEVMGLGEFADSSRGSASSSRSGGQNEAKGVDEISGSGEPQQVEGEDSNSSRQEEKTKDRTGESSFPCISASSSDRPSSFTLRTNEEGGSGGAAFDNALDGLPSYEPEDEDEDWHFSLDSLEDANAAQAKRKENQPSAAQQPRGEDEDREGSSGSANTSHSSQDPPTENSRDGGTMNQTEETEDSQHGEQSEGAPMEDSNLPTSPVIKDEPIDEGYDAALLPQNSISKIKEELEQQEEEQLRISSVFSVGGGNSFATPTMPAPVQPQPQPQPQAAIFIQGRGTVLQAMASLPVRPPASVPTSLPTLQAIPPRPPPPSVPGSVRCSGCSKVLLKGQTAFQRKGSTQLFCSTVCLTGHLPPAQKNRACFQCNREIIQPRDMITIPADDSTLMHFCGQFCLSVYRHKRKQVDKGPEKRPERITEKPPEKPIERLPDKPFCSVCKISNRVIEHEVTHQGRIHRLCSDACFVSWRKMRQLAMNCCEGCGLYCNSKSGSCQTLTVDRSQLNFCGPTCIGTFKQNCRKTTDCAHCHKMAIVSSTVMERDQKGKVQLYCSPTCVERSRPPRHTLAGAAFPCCQCKVSAVPQYHLAMVDGTIRNFCSYDCVTIFRKYGQPDPINGTSSLRDPSHKESTKSGPSVGASSVPPIPQEHSSSVPHPGHHPSHSSVPPLVPSYPTMSSPTVPGQSQAKAPSGQPAKPGEGSPGDVSKLTCHQCSKQFNMKPLLFSFQGRIAMFCSKPCSEQYKTQKKILAVCESCKQEKVPFDTFSHNQQEVSVCSEGCKINFKAAMQSRNRDHPWRSCTYCSSISHKMLNSHYGGRMEEFCRPHCMSQYTVLYYGMGRCDSCRKQGYMNEKLQCLGSVRNFCNMPCLMQYCYHHFEMNQHGSSNGTSPQTPSAPSQPQHSSKTNPVIAGVVSLANGSAAQPNATADTALTGALPTSNVDGKNLDHASTQTDAMRVPAPHRRQMKNKSVLCRPFTLDQESMCKLQESPSDSSAQTDNSESSSAEEKVKVVVVPVPVPVFIPVPLNMYSQHTPVPVVMSMPIPVPVMVPQGINKEMKDAAVQFDPLAVYVEKQNDSPVPSTEQSCSFREDTKSEIITPILPHGDDENQKCAKVELPAAVGSEKSLESTELQMNVLPEESAEAPTTSTEYKPPLSPMTDLESDFPSEFDQRPFAQQRGVKRPREAFSGRKRGRRRMVAMVTPATLKLNHVYGVKAWRSWVQQRNKLQRESNLVDIKEDVIQCDSAELSFALSRFIKEVRRPNGEKYSPDSIFYLCLGIQQYLFMKGRIENIFTDELYSQFAGEISAMLQLWKPKLLPDGRIYPSRVAESYLWECKQLGAYSPIVLLNTLLFFCTKNFRFNTLAQHQSLSFTNFFRCSGSYHKEGTVHYLRHQRSSTATGPKEDKERQRKRKADEEERDLCMLENAPNPLRCPVRIYEFYLSRCPESVKRRADVFYLQPEQNVHTNSPYWYTSQPLEGTTLQSMLTRILAVREVHQEQEDAGLQ